MRTQASAQASLETRATPSKQNRDGVGATVADHPARLAAAAGLVRNVVGSPGRPLEPDVRARFGAQLGHSFEHVRVHTDARASASAHLLGARAYTVGNHVAFADGAFEPGSPEGDRLIAHELVHVLQQSEQPARADAENVVVGEGGGHYDREAAEVADRVLSDAKSPERPCGAAPAAQPVVASKLPRTEALVVQRDLLGGLIGGGIGGLFGAAAGFVIGGPAGAVIGGLAGAAIGGIIGALMSPFPTYADIVGDKDVQAKVGSAWTSTLAATTAATRREEGFWIRLHRGTGKYEFTATTLGPVVAPTVGGSVVLGGRPADVNPGSVNAIYTVGSFHTHTPTAFRPVGRPVGPSGADNAADTSDDVVGVVYDYIASPPGSGAIPAGHPLASPARLWHSGPNRRQKM